MHFSSSINKIRNLRFAVAIFMVHGLIISTFGSPYGQFRTVTLHIVQCPTNHPGRCDLTGQDLTQSQFPRFPSTETYFNAAHNLILTVHPNAFKRALNMKTLALNDNEILYFPPEILCYLKHLDELYLHNNNMITFQIPTDCEPENSVDLSLSGNPFFL